METSHSAQSTDKPHLGAVKTILSLGEERMGEVVNQLLANEKFVSAVQAAISGSLQAKRSVDKGLVRLLAMVNVPTLEDLDHVREKLGELEESLGEIHERLRGLDEKMTKKATEPSAKAKPAASSGKKKKDG